MSPTIIDPYHNESYYETHSIVVRAHSWAHTARLRRGGRGTGVAWQRHKTHTHSKSSYSSYWQVSPITPSATFKRIATAGAGGTERLNTALSLALLSKCTTKGRHNTECNPIFFKEEWEALRACYFQVSGPHACPTPMQPCANQSLVFSVPPAGGRLHQERFTHL